MRGVALVTGTFGLLAVAVLVLTVTPGRPESPIAISATTTPAAIRAAATTTATTAASAASAVPVRAANPTVALAPPASTSTVSESGHATAAGLATALGSGRHAVITERSLDDIDVDERFHVRLPSGDVSPAEIVQWRDDGLVVVSLGESYPAHVIAADAPIRDDIVMVMSHPPVTIAFDDVDELADLHPLMVAEGTAVFDRDGDLVGLCSHPDGDGSVELIELDDAMNDLVSELDDATSDGR